MVKNTRSSTNLRASTSSLPTQASTTIPLPPVRNAAAESDLLQKMEAFTIGRTSGEEMGWAVEGNLTPAIAGQVSVDEDTGMAKEKPSDTDLRSSTEMVSAQAAPPRPPISPFYIPPSYMSESTAPNPTVPETTVTHGQFGPKPWLLNGMKRAPADRTFSPTLPIQQVTPREYIVDLQAQIDHPSDQNAVMKTIHKKYDFSIATSEEREEIVALHKELAGLKGEGKGGRRSFTPETGAAVPTPKYSQANDSSTIQYHPGALKVWQSMNKRTPSTSDPMMSAVEMAQAQKLGAELAKERKEDEEEAKRWLDLQCGFSCVRDDSRIGEPMPAEVTWKAAFDQIERTRGLPTSRQSSSLETEAVSPILGYPQPPRPLGFSSQTPHGSSYSPYIDPNPSPQSYGKLTPANNATSRGEGKREKSLYDKFIEKEQAMKNLTKGDQKIPATNPANETSLFDEYQEAIKQVSAKGNDGANEPPLSYASAQGPLSTRRSFNPHQFLSYPSAPLPTPDSNSNVESLAAKYYNEYIERSKALLNSKIAETKGNGTSLITKGLEEEAKEQNILKSPEAYTKPFCDFLTENPTVWHAVEYFEKKLDAAGFKKLSERKTWNSILEKGGKYYISRNGSSLIAFAVGSNYNSGNGVAMIAGHVDALTARLKPVSTKTTKAGYVQLGVAPYAGALNSTWWDRDLGIGGRVLVKDGTTGKIETKLVKLGWPIARIPTLAPHFGVGMTGQNNTETEAVPIIGLDYSTPFSASSEFENLTLGGAGSFTATQPPKLVRAIAGELSIQDYSSIVNWELELYDTQPAQMGGLEKEFIFAGRIDDKLCSWAAMEALLASSSSTSTARGEDDGIVKLVGVFDDEEIGSLLRQGARGNFLPSTIERISESFAPQSSANVLAQTYANSFLISADVTHAVHPNFLSRYLENHAPRLNVGIVVCADSNGHMTTDSVSTALLTRVAEKSKSELQIFMIRNDSRSGGTVGPMLSSAMGVRAIDAGIPQLSMHSIRATTGALDPGLGVKTFAGFFDNFEAIDKEFE